MRYVLILFLLIFPPTVLEAQQPITLKDSLISLKTDIYHYKNTGDYGKAVITLEKGIKLANSTNNIEAIVDFYNLYARLNIQFTRPVNPEIYLNEAREVLSMYKYPNGQAIAAAIEAYLQASEGNDFLAEQQIKKALGAADHNNTDVTSVMELYIGMTYYTLKQHDKAKKVLQKMIPPVNTYEDKYLLAIYQLLLANIYFDQGNYESAQILLDNALRISARYGFPRILLDTNRLKYEIALHKQEYRMALLYYKKADSIQLKYFNPKALQQQNEAASASESEFLNNVIARMSQDEIKQQQKVNISKLTSVLSSALLIIISLLTISLYRNNQIKFKTNDLLVKKNRELQVAKEEAEKAMRAKGEFLSTVSHELRTPLYAVTGLTHLLLEENPKQSQKEHLKSLKFSGEYLLDFINDILQINKIDANKLMAEKLVFELPKALQDVANSLRQTASENKNTIVLDLDSQIPNKLVGDPLKLSQILINLVGNALKFTEHGKVIVHTSLVHLDHQKCTVHFEVNDEGIGISEEMQKNIFESFAQGSIQINRKYGGTGLGLTIVKSLLSLFNSEIHLKSEVGMGSSFYFDLDFDIPDPSALQEEQEEELEEASLNGLHLLVVEDNKINQVITKKMLGKKGISCHVADNGYEAIKLAKENPYDLILMDIHMPGISGLKTTEEIRKFNSNIPIIALTALSLDDSTDDFFASGCNNIITKPFKPDLFYQTIGNSILKAKSEHI